MVYCRHTVFGRKISLSDFPVPLCHRVAFLELHAHSDSHSNYVLLYQLVCGAVAMAMFDVNGKNDITKIRIRAE